MDNVRKDFKDVFSSNLRRIRKARNVPVYQMSKDTGINYQTLHNYSAGLSLPSLFNAKIIADYLGVTINELVEEKTHES